MQIYFFVIQHTNISCHLCSTLQFFSGDEDPALPEAYGPAFMAANGIAPPPRRMKGKKFSYQSTVRILEMRKLEEKLAREVAEKEKQRLKEMEAMKKVSLSTLLYMMS